MRDFLTFPKKYLGYLRLANPKRCTDFCLTKTMIAKIENLVELLGWYFSIAYSWFSRFFREGMFPPLADEDSTNLCLFASNFFCYGTLSHSFFSKFKNSENFRLGELSHAIGFTARLAVLRNFISSIVCSGSKEQMAWIYAGRIIAFVKNAYSNWNVTDVKFPRNTVSMESNTPAFEKTIPLFTFYPRPKPTCFSFEYFWEKSFFNRLLDKFTVLIKFRHAGIYSTTGAHVNA